MCIRDRFRELKHLTSLSFNLSNSKLSDKGVMELFSDLSCIAKLAHLELNFKGCKGITDKSEAQIIKLLENLKDLREFNLNVSRTAISQRVIQTLYQQETLRKYTKFEINEGIRSYRSSDFHWNTP
eukprot:TRINITY_DN14233_c0_g1_i4.p1 TRINITY_DN14233_c0_g1~~TRINITY_DN14233_c0_g1_i4.p1  ORF type:complete len:126 (+),score=7.15 TRINITY_DN14233_c0_g1_i4:65-442(+)